MFVNSLLNSFMMLLKNGKLTWILIFYRKSGKIVRIIFVNRSLLKEKGKEYLVTVAK